MDDEVTLRKFLSLIMDRFDKLDRKLDKMIHVKDCLNGDDLLDNQDLLLMLGVNERTLYRYRQKGILKYHMVDNGKIYYKKSDVLELIENKRIKM